MENRLSMKIIYYKKLLNMTNETLAKKSGLPIGTISRIASGQTKEPTLKTLRQIAKAFNCTIDDLQSQSLNSEELNIEIIEIAQKINQNAELKNLFKQIEDLPEKNLSALVEIAKAVKKI